MPDRDEFVRLVQRGHGALGPEEQLQAIEEALAIEPRIRDEDWPLPSSREETTASVLRAMAERYLRRSAGREGRERAENLERAIAGYTSALALRKCDKFPEPWARMTNDLGLAYYRRIRGERADNIEKAIELFKAAETVFDRDAFPQEWRVIHGNLANAYCDRIQGERRQNCEQALAAQDAVVELLSRESFATDWARGHSNLARIYYKRIAGDRADNLEKAISSYEAALQVLTYAVHPQDWADVKTNLGNALRERRRGDTAADIEDAIAAHHAALTVFTPEGMPEKWAQTQHNLGLAFEERIHGSHAENVELAIKCYESALSVGTQEALPDVWAMASRNLGVAYQRRVNGIRADNLEKAIANSEAALGIYRRDAQPEEWAGVQNNLATAYMERVRGERAENIERAIAAFEAGLTVYTEHGFPESWADCQNNLGSCFHKRKRGNRADNLERAIAACNRALAVRTQDAHPLGWAGTQQNLADCYLDRIEGIHADNLERAAEACRAALSVFTPEALPRDHLMAATRLGRVLLEMGQYQAAQAMLAGARETFLSLFGLGLDEEDARDVIASAGELFAEGALAAAHLDDAWGAFGLLMEGKARLMSVRLRQQQLQLSPEARERAEALKREVRAWVREAESAEGARGTAVLHHISTLRAELAALMQEAGDGRLGLADVDVARAALQLTSAGAVIVAPVVTEAGGKLLVVSAGQERPAISMFELTETSTRQLEALMFGDSNRSEAGGWLAAYNKNYEMAELRAAISNTLRGSEEYDRLLGRHDALMGEWLDAVESLVGELWRVLGSSIASALQSIGIKPGGRAIWLPTGALGVLPIGLAQEPRGGRRLGETYEIAYGPSLDVLASASARDVPTEAPSLAMINPGSGLASTDFEANAVASHFPSDRRTIIEKDEATIEAVLASFSGRSHWHFATHGTFDWGYARRSALQLSGGERLTIGMLADAEGLVPPRLVVLSACETGIYEFWRNADEFVGLPGTFMGLGAAGVVGTLWPVEDRATALLMAKFYDLHLGERVAPATALHRAQAWLKDATRAELIGYAKAVAAKAGPAQQLVGNKLAGSLMRGGHDDPRFASVSKLLDRKGNASMARRSGLLGRFLERRAKSRLWERPFAHPYYWGGFIYTGV
jgi:CHAT domain-containing protein/tetratricopeptide (TPR) repeat protein